MNRTAFEPTIHAAVVIAALAVSSCAPAMRAPDPVPVNPAHAVSAAAAPVPAVSPSSAVVPMPTVPLTRVGGIVVSEDASAHTLTIRDYSGRTRTFRIAGDARITKGGDEAAVGPDAVTAGDKVRLKVGGDVTASIHVMVSPAQ
jgi:hypothetical protein